MKLDNASEMIAHKDGYVLTQVELCKKLLPVEKEFAKLRKLNWETLKRAMKNARKSVLQLR